MWKHEKLHNLNDYFLEVNHRVEKGVFFYRINGYSDAIRAFIQRYYETARRNGVVIEGRIQNPTEQNLEYYTEILGMDFQFSMGFITNSLKIWLPRMNANQRSQVAASIYDTLEAMRKEGKTEAMLKNAYIKFMCWLYYKFERIINQLGNHQLPKILYEGDISTYELKILSILSNAGCDVVLLQYHGDAGYRAIDQDDVCSRAYPVDGLSAYPDTFSIRWLREELERQLRRQRIFGPPPEITNCTNAWISGKGLDDILKEAPMRGTDEKLFYNCFYRMTGVEDKLIYLNQLYQFYLEMKHSGRDIVVVNDAIAKPSMEEIAGVRRNNYADVDQMTADLAGNIQWTADLELQKVMKKAFADVMLEEGGRQDMPVNRLMNRAIYLLCWLRRYQQQLFAGWRFPDIGCFIYLGGCQDDNERLFLKLLARLPVDVLILVPDRNRKCVLEDPLLYEITYPESMAAGRFPTEKSELQMGTVGYHAERELDTVLYQDSGMFRNQQCTKANSITLRTMYEEIWILWNQELKYRPNFSVVEGVVNVPVLFAKVSGVIDGNLKRYWADIKKLKTEDSLMVLKPSLSSLADPNPMKQYVTEFLKNGKVQGKRIKNHKAYPYGVLREETQNYMLEKLQLLLDMKTIKGTYENGTEYTIVSTVLNLNRDIVRLIQKFDFTKKNPKLIYINTTEQKISLEDSMTAAYLNLIGFDIVFFVPTGYQTVENGFSRKFLEEHQIGEYLYDLQVPDFGKLPLETPRSWRDKIFKRGS